MELYKKLALECEIEKNSMVYIPEESLRFFVRLMIMNDNLDGNYMVFGYTSGLFDGSGNICSKSVEKYYKRVEQEIKKVIKKSGKLNIDEHFGVNFTYKIKTNEQINKNKL